jgi:RNA polymerase sigma factor (sigma-70 family)
VLHASFILIVTAICSDKIKDPDALMSFAHTIIRRQISRSIGSYVRERRQEALDGNKAGLANRTGLESKYIGCERREEMRRCLQQLTPRDREVLSRFYIQEQSKEQICAEMNMTETSFRLTKSRAKAKLTQQITRGMAASSRTAPAVEVFAA